MTNPVPNRYRLLILALLASASQALGQSTPSSQPASTSVPFPYGAPPPVVDAQESEDDLALAQRANRNQDPAEALARYLRVLARDPQHLQALVGAGESALRIGDANAAANFYARAQAIAPQDGDIKAGLGSAMVQLIQPRIALRLFNEATDLGVPPIVIAADRGLAYDLSGNTRHAISDYELALRLRQSPETTRRLAVAQAISGDQLSALATLDPLLRRQDKAAWRMRAFILAIGGDIRGADESARAVLTPAQADALKPFLLRIARLRPPQQAAAVHFGQFPSDGRKYSDTELATASGIEAPVVPVTSTLSRLQKKNASIETSGDDDEGSAPAETAREREKPQRPQGPELTEKLARQSDSDTKKTDKPRESDKATDRSGDKASDKAKDKIADKSKDKDKEKSKDKDKDKEQSAAKKGPERYWVQIATGSYKPDLGKEWIKLKTKYPALLGRYSPSSTALNRTNRLMVGPFKTAEEAQAFVNKAAGSGFGTSRVTIPASQAVERVPF